MGFLNYYCCVQYEEMMLMSCSQMEAPEQGSILFCIPENIEVTMVDGEANHVVDGLLEEVRLGEGDCAVELVIEDGEDSHVFGYSILDSNEEAITSLPSWKIGEAASLTLSRENSFWYDNQYDAP
jgi:hypothetical protein